MHGGPVKGSGEISCGVVCGLDKVRDVVLKDKFGRVTGKLPHGPETGIDGRKIVALECRHEQGWNVVGLEFPSRNTGTRKIRFRD